MTIKRNSYYEMDCGKYAWQYNEFIPICDNCGEELRERYSWKEAKLELDEAGWATFKDDTGRWVNYCPDCY